MTRGDSFDQYGEKASLLPSSDSYRSYSDISALRRRSRQSSISGTLFQREKLDYLIGGRHTSGVDDKTLVYTELSLSERTINYGGLVTCH